MSDAWPSDRRLSRINRTPNSAGTRHRRLRSESLELPGLPARTPALQVYLAPKVRAAGAPKVPSRPPGRWPSARGLPRPGGEPSQLAGRDFHEGASLDTPSAPIHILLTEPFGHIDSAPDNRLKATIFDRTVRSTKLRRRAMLRYREPPGPTRSEEREEEWVDFPASPEPDPWGALLREANCLPPDVSEAKRLAA